MEYKNRKIHRKPEIHYSDKTARRNDYHFTSLVHRHFPGKKLRSTSRHCKFNSNTYTLNTLQIYRSVIA